MRTVPSTLNSSLPEAQQLSCQAIGSSPSAPVRAFVGARVRFTKRCSAYSPTGASCVRRTASTRSSFESPAGNRTSTQSSAATVACATSALNEYTSVDGVAQSYDDNGNLTGDGTNTYSFDAESRLVSAVVSGPATATYAYDPFMRRTRKTVGTTTTYFLWTGDDLLAEYDASGVHQVRYIRRWDRGRDGPSPVGTMAMRFGPPPAQIPACAANALGSCLEFERQSAVRATDAEHGPEAAISSRVERRVATSSECADFVTAR